MDRNDIWTYIVSFNEGKISNIKVITYHEEILLENEEDIANFLKAVY